jgi:O-antigen/teichoic acid export membrane protein
VHLEKKAALSGGAWTLIGFGGEQSIRFVRSLLLTRLLAPELYGLIGLAGIVIGLVGKLSDIGLNISIIRDKRGLDPDFLDTAWTMSVLRGALVWLVACACAWPASRIYEEDLLLVVIPIVGASALIQGFKSTKTATLNRELRLARLTILRVLSQAVGLASTVGWALYDAESLGVLVIGPLVSSVFLTTGSFLSLPGRGNWFCWERDAARELFRFGKWIVLSTAITFFLSQGDQAIVGVIVSTEYFAVYSVAYFLARGVAKVMLALGPRVLLPIYANMEEMPLARIRRRTFKMRGVLLVVFLPIMWVLILYGRYLVWWLYPEHYRDAGWMLEILTAGNVGLVIGLTAGGIVLAKGDSFRFMILQTLRAVFMLVGMSVGYWLGGMSDHTNGALMGFLIGMGVSYWMNYPVLVWAIRRYGTWLPGLDGLAFLSSALIIVVKLVWLGGFG